MGESSTATSANGAGPKEAPANGAYLGQPARSPEVIARHYWKCYADLPRHKKLWRLPDHNARWAWVTILCAASECGGVFESDQHIEAMVGVQNAKYLPVFRRVGLLDGLVVHDWDEWQETEDSAGARERAAQAEKAVQRLERLGLRDEGGVTPVMRTMKEWLEYVVAGPNSQGRLGEFFGAMFGIVPQRGDYGRLSRMMKTYPGGIPALMAGIAEAALRDVSGDPLSYVQKMGTWKNGPVKTTGGRDEYVES